MSGPFAEGPFGPPTAQGLEFDDAALVEAEERSAFLLAVDNAYRAVHGKGLAKVLGLMAQMDKLTAELADDDAQAELVTCWHQLRLALHLIDIEAIDPY